MIRNNKKNTIKILKGTDKIWKVLRGSTRVYCKLPSAYQQVEYIESTGSQYIDTGFVPNQNTGFDIAFYTNSELSGTNYGAIFGARTSSGKNELQLTTYSSDSTFKGTFRFNTTSFNAKLVKQELITASVNNKVYTAPDNSTEDLSSLGSFNAPKSITIFALHQNTSVIQYSSSRIYYFRLYNGTTLERDFVPCYKKSNGEAGLFDLVHAVFYGNAGTGTIIAGEEIFEELPSAYKQVDYIEATGTQYITTAFVPDNTCGIRIKYTKYRGTDGVIIGSRGDTTNSRWYVGANTTSSQIDSIYGGWNTNDVIADRPTWQDDTPFEYKLNYKNNRKRICDDVEYTAISESLNTNNSQAYIFCANIDGTVNYLSSGKLYYASFTRGFLVTNYFVPCYRKSDNEVGVYDLVDRVFYTNQGTGTFTAGQPVTKQLPIEYQQVEYIESTGIQYIDTGLIGKNETKLEIDFSANSVETDYDGICGSRTSASVNDIALVCSGNAGIVLDFNSSAYATYRYNSGSTSLNVKYKAIIDKNSRKLFINGESVGSNTTICNDAITTPTNIMLFAVGGTKPASSSNFNGKIYICKMYDNNVLVRDFIPCYKKYTKVVGMYDLVNGTFYTNQGTGTFTKGADV